MPTLTLTWTWQHRTGNCSSAPGVVPQVACRLMASIQELGQVDRRQIASLAGLDPHARESGLYKGKRKIHGGRSKSGVQCKWLLSSQSDGITTGRSFISKCVMMAKLRRPRLLLWRDASLSESCDDQKRYELSAVKTVAQVSLGNWSL